MTQPRIHFIGLGGIGMSGIARMYLSMGYPVQGSDLKKTQILSDLEQRGAKILIGHDAANLSDADLVVYSSSISEDHPERKAAVSRGLEVIHRAQALARLCEDKFTIAVTGTHGKTTTTAMIGSILREAGLDPSIVVGGIVRSLGGNACFGKGRYMVIEADESDSSFLRFSPHLEVITNCEEEHMDHFKTAEKMEEAYRGFIGRMGAQGHWIGCAEDSRVARFAAEHIKPSTLYGMGSGQGHAIYATDVVECPEGRRGIAFTAATARGRLGQVRLGVLGRHNVLNALAAIAVGLRLDVSFDVIRRALERFEGARRRFDVWFDDANYTIVDDYAHHPTEIQKTLAGAKGLKRKRVFALFQPHRFSRTQCLLADFGRSFFDADRVLVTDIYAAGERPLPELGGPTVEKALREAGHPSAQYVPRTELVETALRELREGDLVLGMGAGDIWQAIEAIAESLKSRRMESGLNGDSPFGAFRGRILKSEPLSKRTTLKIGGPVDYWLEPEDLNDLKQALSATRRLSLPLYLIGLGSNILASDEGLRGVAIHLASPFFKEIRAEGDRLIVRGGATNARLVQFALERGFSGFEFLHGIPGTVGGSIAMNAGGRDGDMGTYLKSVRTLNFFGQVESHLREELEMTYRSSGIDQAIIFEAEFAFPKKDAVETQNRLEAYRQQRARTQDLTHPSAGCMFKNPKTDLSSGRLIDQAGLKGLRVGGAQISEKHANFIINVGGACANDVLALIEKIQSTVRDRFGVDLDTEVKILK